MESRIAMMKFKPLPVAEQAGIYSNLLEREGKVPQWSILVCGTNHLFRLNQLIKILTTHIPQTHYSITE